MGRVLSSFFIAVALRIVICQAPFHGSSYEIRFDHVTFGYETTQMGADGTPVVTTDPVLHDVCFTAKAGQKTALVGESGSGKGTLAKLLLHYYDP